MSVSHQSRGIPVIWHARFRQNVPGVRVQRWALVGLVVGSLGLGTAAPASDPSARAPVGASAALEARLVAQLDDAIARSWQAQGIVPAPRASDGEYLRRVLLDLVGRVPTVGEAQQFLADPSPNKRAELVRRILETPAHARYAASLTRFDWHADTNNDFQRSFQADQVEAYLGEIYADNVPLDVMVRELLLSPVRIGQRGHLNT